MNIIENYTIMLLIEQFLIECCKTKITLPITRDTDNPADQSKLKSNTGCRHEAQENVCKQVTLVLVLLLIG